jgi:hypothetical protein
MKKRTTVTLPFGNLKSVRQVRKETAKQIFEEIEKMEIIGKIHHWRGNPPKKYIYNGKKGLVSMGKIRKLKKKWLKWRKRLNENQNR